MLPAAATSVSPAAAPPPAAESPAPSASYLTLRAGACVSAEIVERKSRFIAQLAHVSSEAEAAAHVADVRARHHDARHNVPVWALAGGLERASDDGEPRGTAGIPVLEVLRGEGLADVCCVVTRYFGGTLLGTGGLARAYAAAAQAAVAAAHEQGAVAEMTLVVPVVARLPYALYDRVRDLATRLGAKPRSCEYAAEVTLSLVFRAGEERPFLDALANLAAGRSLATVCEPEFAEF